MNSSGSSENIAMQAAAATATNRHFHATPAESQISKLRECLDTIEEYYLSLLTVLKNNLQLLYSTWRRWVESAVEENESLSAFKENVLNTARNILRTIESHELYIVFMQRVHSLKCFMFKEVSKQAIYFGCGGLLTGALLGIVVGYGYSIRHSPSNSKANGGDGSTGSGFLMRAIVAANTRRGIDGVTLTVFRVPQVRYPDDVLIQVRAVGIDVLDTETARGYGHALRQHYNLQKVREPFILGKECSGVVADVGSQVESVEINDAVWAYLPLWASRGCMSEYVLVSEKFVGLKPSNISFEGAATMPYSFMTFWTEVVEKNNLNPAELKNKRALIHLGKIRKNDGVGLLATQLLKSWAVRVTISTEETMPSDASGSDIAQMTFLHSLKTLGAESHLIIPSDHLQLSNLAQRLFDIVINCDTSRMTPVLANFCKNPSDKVIETFPIELTPVHRGIGLRSFLSSFLLFPYNLMFEQAERQMDPPNVKLNECKRLVESRNIVPVVAKSFLPSQYDQAFRHVGDASESSVLAQATVGKSVLVFKSAYK